MIELTIEKAKEFNKEYFNNELNINQLKFRISTRMTKTRGTFKGSCKMGTTTITISNRLYQVYEEWTKTLLHEMIHYWQFVKYGYADHGKTFKRKSNDIYKLSKGTYDISRLSKTPEFLRVQNKTQDYYYKVTNKEETKIWFLKKVDTKIIKRLVDNEYKIGAITIDTPNSITFCKNVNYLLRAKYYYKPEVLKRIGAKTYIIKN